MKFSIFPPERFHPRIRRHPRTPRCVRATGSDRPRRHDSGYEALLMPDHLTAMQPAQQTRFEAWSTITGLAGQTTRVRLGLLVASVGYRNPALAAKIASTVDVISNGRRLIFGLGAGWHEADYTQYGFEFGTAEERLRRLEEAAQIVLGLWTEDETTFDGTSTESTERSTSPEEFSSPTSR
jgi:alkanesulfonate monooxygenase SsuD/methylene tetrahydromethanopterin reductase-like flavin-dependent oxidoreductase (luciferase family)